MRSVPLHYYTDLPAADRARLERQVQGHRTFAEVLAWGRIQSPPLSVAEILAQDEYTHDIVVPLRAGLVLVYDTT